MKASERIKLIGKFWEGKTTLNEESELFASDENIIGGNADKAYFMYIIKEKKYGFGANEKIWEAIKKRERRRRRMFIYASSIAASVLIILSIFIFKQEKYVPKNDSRMLVSNEMKDFYNTFGIDYKTEQTLYINGCKSSYDYRTVFQTISPTCIQKVSSTKTKKINQKQGGIIEVWLKGKSDEVFSVCEGTLYFYQDGEIRTITIDDDCSPGLLVDCEERPLSEIAQVMPHEIKSIEFTTDPRNCKGQLNGEFIVLESK